MGSQNWWGLEIPTPWINTSKPRHSRVQWFLWVYYFSSWWFQPLWNICSSNWIISPGIGVKIKNLWNHHLVIFHQPTEGTQKMKVWKMFFLFTRVILRFHVSFPRGIIFFPSPSSSFIRLDRVSQLPHAASWPPPWDLDRGFDSLWHQPSYSQMMSKGCPIFPKRTIGHLGSMDETVLSFGESGFL